MYAIVRRGAPVARVGSRQFQLAVVNYVVRIKTPLFLQITLRALTNPPFLELRVFFAAMPERRSRPTRREVERDAQPMRHPHAALQRGAVRSGRRVHEERVHQQQVTRL